MSSGSVVCGCSWREGALPGVERGAQRFGRVPSPSGVLRWCPTLPHPPRCSTIGAVGLSFRVRNGYRAFPPRHDRRKTVQPVVHTPTWHHCVVWGGCGLVVNPHSGCEQSPLFCLPTHPPVGGGGVLSSVGPLVPVGSQHLAVLPPLAYQPGSMPGASHPHNGGLETSSRSRLPA